MYKINKYKISGVDVFDLTFEGSINLEEMSRWVEDSDKALIDAPQKFSVKVNMCKLAPLKDEVQKKMTEGQILYKKKGMMRSAVLVAKIVIKMQFERLAKESGIYEWERYFSPEDADYKLKMNDWLTGS